MSKRQSIGSLIAGIACEGLSETIGQFCTAAATGDASKIAAVVGGLTGGPLVAIGLLAAGTAFRISGDRKRDQAQAEAFKKLADEIARVGADQECLVSTINAFANRTEFVVARLPGHDKADLADRVSQRVIEAVNMLSPDASAPARDVEIQAVIECHADLLEDLRDQGARIEAATERIETTTKRTESTAAETLDEVQRLHQRLDQLERMPPELSASGRPMQISLRSEDRARFGAYSTKLDLPQQYLVAVATGDLERAREIEPRLSANGTKLGEGLFEFNRILGHAYFAQDKYDQAANMYRQAMNERDDDPAVLGGLAIAQVMARQHIDFKETVEVSERLLERAIVCARAEHEGDDPIIATCLHNLARVRVFQGPSDVMMHPTIAAIGAEDYWSKTRDLCQSALDMRERLYPVVRYPNGHREIAASIGLLALITCQQVSVEEGLPIAEESLRMYERLYPASEYPNGHVDLAQALGNMATPLKVYGQVEDARALAERALAMQRQLFDPSHINVGEACGLLATIEYELHDDDSAHKLAEEALFITANWYEGDHPDTAAAMHLVACIAGHQTDFERADRAMTAAIGMGRRCMGVAHPRVMAWMFDAQGLQDAKWAYEHNQRARQLTESKGIFARFRSWLTR